MRNLIIIARLSLILAFLAVFVSCKTTKQSVSEKIVKVADSTAITELKKEVSERDKTIFSLKQTVKMLVSENQKLEESYEFYRNTYDTSKPIDRNTGKPPIKEEVGAKKTLVSEKEIKTSYEKIKNLTSEYEKEKKENDRLSEQIKSISKENTDLKSKSTEKQNTVFAWRVFLVGIIFGAVARFLIVRFVKFLIAKLKLKMFA